MIRCSRCGRRYRDHHSDAQEWNLTASAGIVVGYICPGCQTPEEDLEAQVNLATTEYLGRDAFGRLVGRVKIGDAA